MPNAQFDFAGLARRYAEAWTSSDRQAVARFYGEDGEIVINRGAPHRGHAAIAAMAADFHAAFPDLVVHCDLPRRVGDHAIFAWTLEGRHVETRTFVKVSGWEA